MLDHPLLKACIQHLQILEQSISPHRVPNDRDALADNIQVYISYIELLDRTQNRLLIQCSTKNNPESVAIGSLLTSLMQSALTRASILKRAIIAAEEDHPLPDKPSAKSNTGLQTTRVSSAIESKHDFYSVLARLEKLMEIHSRDWPVQPAPDYPTALQAEQQGELQSADAAFAEILGVSETEWATLVQQHAATRGASQ